MDQITVTLRNKNNELLDVFIDVIESSLSTKWLTALNILLQQEYHLEKNYHWMGFSERDLPILCDKINLSCNTIKMFNWENVGLTQYDIPEYFTAENTIVKGDIGPGLSGGHVNHEMFNNLHRHFEELQGQAQKR